MIHFLQKCFSYGLFFKFLFIFVDNTELGVRVTSVCSESAVQLRTAAARARAACFLCRGHTGLLSLGQISQKQSFGLQATSSSGEGRMGP